MEKIKDKINFLELANNKIKSEVLEIYSESNKAIKQVFELYCRLIHKFDTVNEQIKLLNELIKQQEAKEQQETKENKKSIKRNVKKPPKTAQIEL